jgi:hypothetical protein
MNKTLAYSKIYLEERVPVFPWFFIPLILFFLVVEPKGSQPYVLIYNLLWGVYFFRILNDFIAWDYNKSVGAEYTRVHPTYLFPLLLICFLLFFSSAVFIYPIYQNLVICSLLVSSILSLILLKKSSYSQHVILLMYPVFLYLIAEKAQVASYLWVYIGSAFYIVRDLLKIQFKKHNPYMEYVVLGSFFVSKYVLNF